MTKRSLADLKNAFGNSDRNEQRGDQPSNNYYPFWNMEIGQRAIVRFLPDRNDNNPRGFLVEKVFHNLHINGQKKTVPCLSMYGEDCPVCKVSQDYYKVKDQVNGKKYWRKKQYLAQAFIVEDPLPADEKSGEKHAGKVRYIALGWQLYNIIKEAFASEEDALEAVPYDLNEGYDFVIKKTAQGEHASYAVGSKFLSKQRGLGEEELGIVEDGMIDLVTLLPKNPGLEKVQAMLNADLNGEALEDSSSGDEEVGEEAPKASKPAAKPAAAKPAAKPESKPAPAKTEAASEEGSSDVDAMLAAIRARRTAAK